MPIKAKTTYTREKLLRFQLFLAFSKKIFWAFMIACSTFVISICTVLLVQQGFIKKTFLYLMLIIIIDLLCVFTNFILPFINVKKVRSLNSVVEYSIDDEGINISVKGQSGTETGTVPYLYIQRVVKDKEVIYAFIGKLQAYIVDISELDDSQRQELKTLFINKLGPKRVKWK